MLCPPSTNHSIRIESRPAAVQLSTIVVGVVVMAGAVSSIRIKLAEVVSKLLQPSPAINITWMAASQVSAMDGDGGYVLQKIELQSSDAVAPPWVAIQLLNTEAIFG